MTSIFSYQKANKNYTNDDEYKEINTIINDYKNNKIEVIKYDYPIKVKAEGCAYDSTIDRTPLFKLQNGLLIPQRDGATKSRFDYNQEKASKRAMDNFYGYGYSNTWTHFATFTFSNNLCNRNDDEEVKLLWSQLRRKLQTIDNNIKILCTPERHKNLALHFHSLINFRNNIPIVLFTNNEMLFNQRYADKGKYKGKKGFCTYKPDGTFTVEPKTNYKYYCVPYYEYGELQKSASGNILFCFNFYKYGRCSFSFIPQTEFDQMRCINYCVAYTTKECNLGYKAKRFYRTQNLEYKKKVVIDIMPRGFSELLKKYDLKKFKEFDKKGNIVTVYRNFNLRKSTEQDKLNLKQRLER